MKVQKKIISIGVTMLLVAAGATMIALSLGTQAVAGAVTQDELQIRIVPPSGAWFNSGAPATQEYNGQSRYTNTIGAWAEYTFDSASFEQAGKLPIEIYLRWSPWSNRSTKVKLVVQEDTASGTREMVSKTIDQSLNADRWVKVFTYFQSTTTTLKLRIQLLHNDTSGTSTCIDAAKITWGGGGGDCTEEQSKLDRIQAILNE